MDLYSDFDPKKWSNKGEPPKKLSSLEGYSTNNILRTSKVESPNGDRVFTYYMSTNAGLPVHGVIYGAARDALKGIGHCGIKIVDKNNVNLITGCIVEDDWVEMNQEYFDSLEVQGELKVEKKEARISMIFGLLSDLDTDKWSKKEDPPKNKSSIGYTYVTIVREDNENGERSYYISDPDGKPLQAYLDNSLRDPLRSVGNCFLKLVNENGKENIKGIIVDQDWVEAN